MLEILGVVLIFLALGAATAGAVRSIYNAFALPGHVRTAIKQLRSDINDIDDSLEACRSLLATATGEHGLSYYPREIETLTARRAEKVQQIESLKVTARTQQAVAALAGEKSRRAPAPKLNPRWDKTAPACYHEEIEPVFTESEGDKPVGWICVKCLDSLDENSPEAKNWTVQQKREFARAKADAEWRAIWASPLEGEADREERRLNEMEAIVAARDAGQLSVKSAKELLNNEPGDVEVHAWGSPDPIRSYITGEGVSFSAGGVVVGDQIITNPPGDDLPPRGGERERCFESECINQATDGGRCRHHAVRFDKGGYLPPGKTAVTSEFVRAHYLQVMPNLQPLMEQAWEKLPGWTEADTARARQIIQAPPMDDDSDWWKPVEDEEK